MAPAVTGPAPLRFSHVSGLVAVVEELDAMHRESLRVTAGEAGEVHLSVANIVAACTDATIADRADAVLTRIGERHPARAIVLIADPARATMLDADIALRSAPGTDRVCTEIVRLVVHGEPAYHLAGIVTPLLIPDIPVHLWLVGAPRMEQAFESDTVALCDRIVLDSGGYEDPVAALGRIASALAEHGEALCIGDIAWQQTREWRELCAQAFDPAGMRERLGDITHVGVRSAGHDPSAQAWLLAGWFASRLDWPDAHGPALAVEGTVEPGIDQGDLLGLRIHGERGEERFEVVITRSATSLHTTVRVPSGTTQRTVVAGRWDMAELVGGLMADASDAHVYAAAVSRVPSLAR